MSIVYRQVFPPKVVPVFFYLYCTVASSQRFEGSSLCHECNISFPSEKSYEAHGRGMCDSKQGEIILSQVSS